MKIRLKNSEDEGNGTVKVKKLIENLHEQLSVKNRNRIIMKILKRCIKICCFVVLVMSGLSSYGQPENDQYSLSKYTYLVIQYAKDPIKSGNASGFFVRKGKRLYLVTCFHVFTGFDSWSGNDKGPYDSIRVRYYDNEKRVQFFTIKSPSDGFDFRNFKEDPDIHFYEVTGSFLRNAIIYSIEKFIDIARQKKSFNSRQIISYQFSRSEDDVIAEQVKSIMRNYEFSSFRNTMFPNPSISDKVVFPSLIDQSENNIHISDLPVWASKLNNSLLGDQTLFKVDTGLFQSYLNTLNIEIFPIGSVKLGSQNTMPVLNDFSQWSSQNILPSIKSYGNSVINSDTSIFTFITTDTLLFTNYFAKKNNLFSSEKLGSLQISANVSNEEPIWSESFEKFISPLTSFAHQDSLSIFSNFGETSLISKNGYSISFDSIKNTYLTLQGQYKLSDEKANSLDFATFRVNDIFLNTIRQIDDLNSLVRDNSQNISFSLPQIKFTDIDQSNKEPFMHLSLQDVFAQVDFTLFPSVYYTAEAVDGATIGINDPKLYDNYFTSMPPSAPGGSGSPLFYLCKGTINNKQMEWIEFAGMQCANINRSTKYLLVQEIQPVATIILNADAIIQELDLLK